MPSKFQLKCSRELLMRRLKRVHNRGSQIPLSCIEVDLRLSVIKPLHATWLVSLYNHLTSCEGKRHIAKGWEKASIALVANGKMQFPLGIPSRIVSLSPCNAVSSPFWSTSVLVLCTSTEHLKLRFKH